MRREDFVFEIDPAALQMENELLLHEVAHLKSKIRLLEAGSDPAPSDADSDVSSELAMAKKDLRWMLTRLDAPPIGWLLRRRSGFQNLWSRWMESPDAK